MIWLPSECRTRLDNNWDIFSNVLSNHYYHTWNEFACLKGKPFNTCSVCCAFNVQVYNVWILIMPVGMSIYLFVETLPIESIIHILIKAFWIGMHCLFVSRDITEGMHVLLEMYYLCFSIHYQMNVAFVYLSRNAVCIYFLKQSYMVCGVYVFFEVLLLWIWHSCISQCTLTKNLVSINFTMNVVCMCSLIHSQYNCGYLYISPCTLTRNTVSMYNI